MKQRAFALAAVLALLATFGWALTRAQPAGAELAGTQPAGMQQTVRPQATAALPANVQIFYYPWWGNPSFYGSWRHWQQGGHTPPDDIGSNFYPVLGPYDSGDYNGAVAQQMQWLRQADVGVIIYSWWGQGSYEDQHVAGIMNVAAQYGIKVAFHIEPYSGRTAASVVSDINYIDSTYGSSPAFYRDPQHGNKPVFYIFDSLAISDWSPLAQVDQSNIILAQTTDTSKVAYFGGMYTYDAIAGDTAPGWAQASAYCKQHGLIWAPSVGPGFDNTRAVPGSTTPTLDRNNGATYDTEWNNALGTSTGGLPTWVTITSFNEWHEGTEIEPATSTPPSGYGYLTFDGAYGQTGTAAETAYLNRTAYWVNQFESLLGAGAEGPYGGTAAAVPGTVQAANYDTGGQGVAYNVTSVNGTANSYRSDGVDLETCTDTGCGYDLGWTAAGQWFRYTINVASAGSYTVSFRVASPNGVSDAFHIADTSGADLTGAVSAPATGGWQNWTTVTASVTLPAGQQTLTADQDNGGWNIRYLSFASASGGSALTASPSSLSFGSQAVGSASAAQTVTVSNPGSSAVSVSQLAVSGPFTQTSTCGNSIAAGGSCTVSVKFAPTASGAASGTLSVASSAPGSPLTVALSGTGVSSSTNLALGQPVTASGYTQTYVPANAVDGNTSTYWESTDNAFPQWFQADLGSQVSISRIVMDLPPSSAWGTRTQTIIIQGSTDGTSYTTLVPSAGYTFNPSTGNTATITFPAATVRYVKLTFTANTGWPAGQLSELQIYTS
jgi:Glycosyl hydrolase family 99/Carbohydrate binding module (family 6)/F5/8 type C domain/Abnormal spindle-like microcephaly-assoc'd, ASPM-SPD-2-Hydin